MGFAFASDHGARSSIARFSVQHSITGSDAWVAAFVLMAPAEAVTRMVVIRLRAYGTPAPRTSPVEG